MTTRAQKQAFHAVTCNNSREPMDVMLAEKVVENIGKVISDAGP